MPFIDYSLYGGLQRNTCKLNRKYNKHIQHVGYGLTTRKLNLYRRVSLHMECQMIGPGKSSITQLTMEGFVPRMFSLVPR